MKWGKMIVVFMFFLIGFIIGCAPKGALSPEIEAPGQLKQEQEKAAIARDSWEVEWATTLQAAKKEGKVVVSTVASLGPTYREIAPLIKEKFGIELQVLSFGRGAEQSARFNMERKAGLFLTDVFSTGTNTFFGQLEPAGIDSPMEPVLLLPEILEKKNWYGGELHWVDSRRTALHLLAYPSPVLSRNTELVKKEEVTSYRDLLNPKWKGKIVMNDPTTAGTGIKSFSVLGFHILDLDFFRQLVKQEPVILRDQRLQVDWLSRGKFSLHFFPRSSDTIDFQDAGAPIAFIVAKEGTYYSRDGGATGVVNQAPHPNAARLLINWLFSKEGMSLVAKTFKSQVSRIDVPIDFLPPERKLQPGVYYFPDADNKQWVARDDEYQKAAQEIFGHLIR